MLHEGPRGTLVINQMQTEILLYGNCMKKTRGYIIYMLLENVYANMQFCLYMNLCWFSKSIVSPEFMSS